MKNLNPFAMKVIKIGLSISVLILFLYKDIIAAQENPYYSLVKHAYSWGYVLGYPTGKFMKEKGELFDPETMWKNEAYQAQFINKWFLSGEHNIEHFKRGWLVGMEDGYYGRPFAELVEKVTLSHFSAISTGLDNFVNITIDGPYGREVFQYKISPLTFNHARTLYSNFHTTAHRLFDTYSLIRATWNEGELKYSEMDFLNEQSMSEIKVSLKDNIFYLKGLVNLSIFSPMVEALLDLTEVINTFLVSYSNGDYDEITTLTKEIELKFERILQNNVSIMNSLISTYQQWRMWVNSWDYHEEIQIMPFISEDIIKEGVKRITAIAHRDINTVVVPKEYFNAHELLLQSATLFKISGKAFESNDTGVALNALDGAIDKYIEADLEIKHIRDIYDMGGTFLMHPYFTLTTEQQNYVYRAVSDEIKNGILAMDEQSQEKIVRLISQNINHNANIRMGIIVGGLKYSEDMANDILAVKEKQFKDLPNCEILTCLIALFHDLSRQNILAEEYYSVSLCLNPSDVATLYLYGAFLAKQSKFDDAIVILEKAFSIDDKDGVSHQLRPFIRRSLSNARIGRGSARSRRDGRTRYRWYW